MASYNPDHLTSASFEEPEETNVKQRCIRYIAYIVIFFFILFKYLI